MDLLLNGKIALVAASSRGLGRAISEQLAAEGCRVMLTARDAEALAETARQVRSATGGEVAHHPCDLTSSTAIEALFAAVQKRFGQLDILVNNCGGPPGGSFSDCNDAAWQGAFELTLLSYVRLVRAVLEDLKASRGRIVNIASSSIRQPIPGLILSNVFRAGVLGLGKSLADELAPAGVLVNTVAPGRIATDRTAQLDARKARQQEASVEQIVAAAKRAIPLGRYGEPEEFARVVAFLVSGANTYLTGQAIAVDGGLIRAL